MKLTSTQKSKLLVVWELIESITIANDRYNVNILQALNNDLDYIIFKDIIYHHVIETVTTTKYINKDWFHHGQNTDTKHQYVRETTPFIHFAPKNHHQDNYIPNSSSFIIKYIMLSLLKNTYVRVKMTHARGCCNCH